jgi:hypothetical protein
MNVIHTLQRVGQTARMRARGLRRALLRLPNGGRSVKAGPSVISGTGVFVLRSVKSGESIGAIELGPPVPQDRHTLLVGAHHRDVKEPWRYLNHACVPTATIRFDEDTAQLIAARDLHPYTELTIDYNALPEDVGSGFECRCARCSNGAKPSRIGS